MQLKNYFNRGVFLSLLLAVFGIILMGCDSGGGGSSTSGGGGGGTGGGGDLTTTDAETQLRNVDTGFAADLGDLTNGELGLTLQGLFFGTSGSTTSSKASQPIGFTLIDRLDTQNIVGTTPDGRLTYSSGEYDWDSNNQEWDPPASSNSLVLNFPTAEGINNNATFTLSAYSDEAVTLEGRTQYLPTTVDASLTVDGKELFSVDLSGTDFYTETLNTSDGAYQLPRQFMLDILTAPLRHTLDYESPSKREFDIDFELSKANTQERILRLLVGLTFTQNFDAASGAGDVQIVEGEIGFGPDVVLAYTVDVAGLDQLGTSPSPQEINNQFTATMRYRGSKMGVIEWGTLNGQPNALFVYNDGSKVLLASAFSQTSQIANSTPAGMVTLAMKTVAAKTKTAVTKVFQP
jgi:hypothetical protein